MEVQAALETAVVQAIIAQLKYPSLDASPAQVAYSPKTCGRSNNGKPPPIMGQHFVAVWHDGSRESKQRTAKYEVFGLRVTVTCRSIQPYDRKVATRDRLEVLLNPIAALIHLGIAPGSETPLSIINAASALVGLNPGGANNNFALPVGFRESLQFQRYESVTEVGPDWFEAHVDARGPNDGMTQTAVFGGANRIQSITVGMT